MASSFQRQSRVRKLSYTAAIVVLFTLTLVWRHSVIEAQANTLELREQSLGKAELTGSIIRLTLTGSRGVAVCFLWSWWDEARKRQEWNEQEVYIGILTKLQPHFRAPWFFHSWHLAYNIPAECDRVSDKYFYITRGIQLAAQGEQQNNQNPDFRHWVGWLYHNKLGSADEQNTLRSLFQLSCIPPNERDPQQLLGPDGRVNLNKFQKFCEAHPFLVRRLREHGGCKTPLDVVKFLEQNREVPTRYENKGVLKVSAEQQFPVLPHRGDMERHADFTAEDYFLPDEFDNCRAAMLWMFYSQEPLPEAKDSTFDPMKYRLNRRMATAIFRSYPALMQTHYAERLQKEGWFDERGWVVDEGRLGPSRWFPGRVVLGAGRNWTGEAWQKARDFWVEYGERTGLYLRPEAQAAAERQAQKYRTAYDVGPNENGPEPRADADPEMMASFETHRQLVQRANNRRITNFDHYFAQAQAEYKPEAVAAHRLFFQAKQKAADPSEAMRLYEQGFAQWKKVLDSADDFRADPAQQEELYRTQYDYLALVKDQRGTQIKQLLLVQDLLSQAAARPALVPLWLPPAHLVRASRLPPDLIGPFDGDAKDGKPYFTPTSIIHARSRLGLSESPARRTTEEALISIGGDEPRP